MSSSLSIPTNKKYIGGPTRNTDWYTYTKGRNLSPATVKNAVIELKNRKSPATREGAMKLSNNQTIWFSSMSIYKIFQWWKRPKEWKTAYIT